MTEMLTMTRFRDLADAYGGAVARWPDRYQDAAAGLAATPQGAAILAAAATLDTRLDEWRVASPGSDLAARIAARAPVTTRRSGAPWRWWWSAAGLAATLAGAVVGTAAVAVDAPAHRGRGSAGTTPASTSFGDIAGLER